MNEWEAKDLLKGLSKFMNNTNEMLASMQLKIDNLQVDINKLKKEFKNNGKVLI